MTDSLKEKSHEEIRHDLYTWSIKGAFKFPLQGLGGLKHLVELVHRVLAF
jgi:hypothetical protein